MELTLCQQKRGSAIVARRELCAHITSDWFDAACWGGRAEPVTSGGRGTAWFIHSDHGEWVLRRYQRGGLPAKFSKHGYLFAGRDRVRSIAEARLLATLRELGLPVPGPVAAGYRRHGGLLYEAAILIERIPGTVTLDQHPDVEEPALWRQVGAVVCRFHRAGVDHVDLNVHNILCADGEIYLIDFDRCRLRAPAQERAWQYANLRRLHRSVSKYLPGLGIETRERLWQNLLDGYERAR